MLNVIANNFGVPPAEMRIKEYSSERLFILDGEFSVDTTDENYKAARYMTLSVSGLPFPKSRETTGFAHIEVDGVRHITLFEKKVFTPVASLGDMLNAECNGVETADWVMFYFTVEDLIFDEESGEINADLCAFPQGRIFTMPLIYNESYYNE